MGNDREDNAEYSQEPEKGPIYRRRSAPGGQRRYSRIPDSSAQPPIRRRQVPREEYQPPRARRKEYDEVEYEPDYQDEDAYTDDELYTYPSRPSRRSAAANPRPNPSRQAYHELPQRQRRKKRAWPVLISGCALGMLFAVLGASVIVLIFFRANTGSGLPGIPSLPGVNNPKAFPKEETTTVPLSAISQLHICDKAGNVTLKVDNQITQPTITTRKTVHALSQSEADQQFKALAVEIQPPASITQPTACTTQQSATSTATSITPIPTTTATSNTALMVNVVFPNSDTVNTSVDITILIPRSATPTDNPTMQINVEAPAGNIAIDGLSGILNIKGGTGTIAIQHAVLADGSRINSQGNINFNGLLDLAPTGQNPPKFILQSEYGIEITLPENVNIKLDANTNVGTIKSDFNTPINNPDKNGPVNYFGPLNPASTVQPTAILTLDVSTGNVIIHRAQI